MLLLRTHDLRVLSHPVLAAPGAPTDRPRPPPHPGGDGHAPGLWPPRPALRIGQDPPRLPRAARHTRPQRWHSPTLQKASLELRRSTPAITEKHSLNPQVHSRTRHFRSGTRRNRSRTPSVAPPRPADRSTPPPDRSPRLLDRSTPPRRPHRGKSQSTRANSPSVPRGSLTVPRGSQSVPRRFQDRSPRVSDRPSRVPDRSPRVPDRSPGLLKPV